MKSICTLLLLITACAPSATYAQRTRVTVRNGGSTSWIGGSALQTRVHVGADGQTYVGIWVDAPSDVAVRERAPMALSLVVDTSGSMSGAKIQHARLATQSLLESLQDGDIVSIYAFSNEVVEIAAPTVVSSSTRGTLMTQANRLHAMG
ncbi:MAG: VWA domain-containing protein, partial [Myxococcota bacterium]